MSEMDPHLQNALYGTPKLNPDEQNKYLGAYRERVYAVQSESSLENEDIMALWADFLKKYPDAVLKLNGHLETDELMPYMQLAKKYNVEFSMVTDSASARNNLVAVLVADHAVHKQDISLEDMLANKAKPEVVVESNEAPKKKWYQRFF